MIKKLILTILLASISGMLWAQERTQKSIDSLKHELAVAKNRHSADCEGAEFIIQLTVN
jgi:hypothetical protein